MMIVQVRAGFSLTPDRSKGPKHCILESHTMICSRAECREERACHAEIIALQICNVLLGGTILLLSFD